MKKVFCNNCMLDTDCEYEEKVIKETIDGIEIEYLEKRYICSICHEKTYDDESFDYNVLEANKKLREKTGLITLDEIKQLMKKYAIGIKPLSLALGFGEVTLSRYLDGKNPTREISDKLKMAFRSPEFFEMELMENKSKLTDVAFRKAIGRVKQYELSREHSKVYQIALYIISKYEDTTNMALQKILYFVNGFSNKFLGGNLFNDLAQAWVHGPVYPDIYDSLSYFKADNLNSNNILCDYNFEISDSEKEYIDNVAPLFACFSGSYLRNMSHLTDPWVEARKGLDDDEYSSRYIDQEDTKKYFDGVIAKYDIKNYMDIRKYIDDLLKIIEEQNNNKKVNN